MASNPRKAANARLRKPPAPLSRKPRETDDAYLDRCMAALYRRAVRARKRDA